MRRRLTGAGAMVGALWLLVPACQPPPEPPRYALGVSGDAEEQVVTVHDCPIEEGEGRTDALAVSVVREPSGGYGIDTGRTVWAIELPDDVSWQVSADDALPDKVVIGGTPPRHVESVRRLPLRSDGTYVVSAGFDEWAPPLVFRPEALQRDRLWDGERFVDADGLADGCDVPSHRLGHALIVGFAALVVAALFVGVGAVLLLLFVPTVLAFGGRGPRTASAGGSAVTPAPSGAGRPPVAPVTWWVPPPSGRPADPTVVADPQEPPVVAPPWAASAPADWVGASSQGRRRLGDGQVVLVVLLNVALLVPLYAWSIAAQSGGSEVVPAAGVVVGVEALLVLADALAERNAGRRRSHWTLAAGLAVAVPPWLMLSGALPDRLTSPETFLISVLPLAYHWWRLLRTPAGPPPSSP